jgi:lanosterol synthase
MYAKYPHPEPIEKGVRLVMSRQRPVSLSAINPLMLVLNGGFQDGSWPQEAIEGIFSKTCTITYPNFRVAFPVKMLGTAHYYLASLKAESSNGKANGNGHNSQ